jgi:MFS family permease
MARRSLIEKLLSRRRRFLPAGFDHHFVSRRLQRADAALCALPGAVGFSPITVTVIFGIYAISVLTALLFVGRLSDHLGRRPVLIAATAAQTATMVIFATASGVGDLVLARIIQGLATGAAVGAVGAGMIDLNKERGATANAVAPAFGTATGGMLSGYLVQYLPAPTHLVYAVLCVIFVLQGVGVALMADTIAPAPGALASLKPQLSLPARHAGRCCWRCQCWWRRGRWPAFMGLWGRCWCGACSASVRRFLAAWPYSSWLRAAAWRCWCCNTASRAP